MNFPRKPVKKQPRVERTLTCVLDRRGVGGEAEYLIVQRPSTGLLAMMWEFPSLPLEERDFSESKQKEAVLAQVQSVLGGPGSLGALQHIGEVLHIFTHIHQTYVVYRCSLSDPTGVELREGEAPTTRWVTKAVFQQAAVSTAMKKVLKLYESKESHEEECRKSWKRKRDSGSKDRKRKPQKIKVEQETSTGKKQLSLHNFFQRPMKQAIDNGLGGLRAKLSRRGLSEVGFLIVNEKEPQARAMYWELKRRAPKGVPVYQQDPLQQDVWETLGGEKDDFLIYDRCGKLTFHIPLPYSFLHRPYIEAAVLATYHKDICGNCSMASVCWWFFFSKVIELLDTVFFLLRKKNNQITFLHVYHHATMIFNWWAGVKYVAGGQSFFIGMLNSFVHIVMYLYYGLAALGPRMQRYLWWKRYLTILQLLQFFGIAAHTSYNLFTDCAFPDGFNLVVFLYIVSLILLFSSFYHQTYISRKTKQT
ncbi:Elongation of very long chain fatty acids protein 4 [Acipenser ruthenus]|uniref:Adenine DNA glycosylase n=1 Tax=Acipenser ruthenus TaxID=7906 RepID=A0A444U1L2_ACIRT|nr:Elongation of very long chain fatty acids protein 4 [Acipenser ruthenus]